MRILHLIPSLGGGGAERQLTYLADGLRALGCDVHVAMFKGGPNLPLLEASGATLHPLSTGSNYDPRILFRLVRLIRRVRPDVVQTWLPQMDVFGGVAALLTRTPWVISERTSSRHHPRSMQWWLRNAVGRHANAVVANSEVGLDRWEESGPERFVIRNAVAFAEIDATPPDTADYGSSRVIVFAGRLTVEKNVLNLIAALREVMEQRDAVALFCGEGPMEDEIRAAIAAAGLTDRVRLLGYVDNLPAIVKRADVVVAPSWYEGHPNVSTDAAACGCPLVVSDIPAHGWLSDNAALFAPPGDPRAIAAAILQTLDDPAAARARGLRAREIVREWSVERAASSYLNLYRELRAKRAGS